MTVADLKKLLADADPNALVVLATKPEGNDYRLADDGAVMGVTAAYLLPPERMTPQLFQQIDQAGAFILWPQ